jgi:outer membrane receptor protein involved in Fe transport
MRVSFKDFLLAFIFSLSLIFTLGATPKSVNSNYLKGATLDSHTGEVLIGATVYIKELQAGTTSGFDGSFFIKNIPAGTYTLKASYIGYESIEQKITVANNQNIENLILNFKASASQLDEVVLKGKQEKHSELSARSSEKESLTVLNVVSAKAIELSPDIDVASVVQRMSGVTMERNSSGDAQYAILRGMDKRYNYTLVNGIKISSPNNTQRYVPLNLFPSDIVDRIEVYKSLTADMEGDASGGVVNIVMKDAPEKLLIQANASLGYNSFYLNNNFIDYPTESIIVKSPREQYGMDYRAESKDFDNQWGKLYSNKALPNGVAGLTLGNRFFNKKFGIILATNFQNHYKGSNSTYYNDSYSQQENTTIITKQQERIYNENQRQYGVHLKNDYRINNNHKLEWYNALLKMDNFSVRETTSTNFGLLYDPNNGNLDLNYQTRLRTNNQSIYVSNLKGTHQINSKYSFDWSGVYSTANHKEPEKSYFNLDEIRLNSVNKIYPDADGSTREWSFNSDTDVSIYANLKYETAIKNATLTLKTGGLHRDKNRNNSQVEYRFKPDGTYVKGENFNTLNQIQWILQNPRGSVGALEYDAYEKISAGYLQSHLKTKWGDINLGARIESTNQGYFMYFPGPEDEPNGNQKYVDILPSAVIKYTSNSKTNWKASYFKSINRPGFFEVVPYLMIQEDFLEFGNKNLQRAIIDNIDFRWEYFPKPTEQIFVGLFYKHLKNPIEISYTTVNRRQFGYGPSNLGNAQNIGLEIDYIKYIRSFGVKANYTYTLSRISTQKAYYGTDENDNFTLLFKEQNRTLSGQSPHVGNISIFYKDVKRKWDAQIAASYTHDKLIIASRFLDSDYWQYRTFQLDASFEKTFKHGISFFGKLNNILDTPLYNYIAYSNSFNENLPGQQALPKKTLIRKDLFGRTILLGIRIKI